MQKNVKSVILGSLFLISIWNEYVRMKLKYDI
jgi:hypothetical protein